MLFNYKMDLFYQDNLLKIIYIYGPRDDDEEDEHEATLDRTI
jgi:hypothetical protein